MPRKFAFLLLTLGLGAGVFAGAYLISQQVCATHLARSADDLDWLRHEFRLSESELARIRELHDGYLPHCQEMCRLIAEKKREVDAALASVTNLVQLRDIAGPKLGELALLRAECQLQMLAHFAEVSRAMPPEQGRRYLAEMQRITLGFHEQIEQSMADSPGHAHGHH